MTIPETAVFFEILDLRTGDTLAAYERPEEAEAALVGMVDDSPAEAQFLCMTFFDKRGVAIGSRLATELTAA